MIDERYFISGPLNQYFVDKTTGLPLAGGTLTFYRDSARTTPKNVYQLTGSPPNYTYTAFSNPITLSSVGTVQNSGGDNEIIYFYPYDADGALDLYYIVCKDSDGIEQFTREGWPNLGAGNDPTQNDFTVLNQLSNCQFSRVLINSNDTTTYTASASSDEVFAFAPDWDFVISGTGTVIVERVAISGNDDVPTNPSYMLEVTLSAGITACYLRQRFLKNSSLFATGFLSGNFVARNEGVGTVAIDLLYAESSGATATTPLTIVSGSVDTTYDEQQGSVEIPDSNNTQSGASAYVDIYLSFPASSVTRVTSIQIAPTGSDAVLDYVPFNQISANRDQARMGDYYIPLLEEKAIPSLLTGWDFPLNPAQFGSTKTITGSAAYVWDQTIATRVTANVAMIRSTFTSGAQFTNSGATEAYYIMQYLSGAQAKKIIGTRLSVNVNAFKGTAGASTTCRVYLFRAPAATAIPTLTSSIGTIAATGIFTLTAAGWTEIPRSGLDTASADLTTVTTEDDLNDGCDYGFSGWELTTASQIADTDKFAIVVTFETPTASTVVTVNSISLVPGDIPTRPAPQTPNQVLNECRYYFEMSYNGGGTTTPIATATSTGVIVAEQTTTYTGGTTVNLIPRAFNLSYKSPKRIAPTLNLYAENGTIDNVTGYVYTNGAVIGSGNIATTNWTAATSLNNANFLANNVSAQVATAGANTVPEGFIRYSYTLDSRLGLI